MAHVVKLRVKDTTSSTGTGAKVLARTSLLNFRTFDSVMANGDTCDAIVVNRSANQWEHSSWTIAGVGSEPVLTRLEFKESSTGAIVHFTEGTKDVLMLYPVAGKLDFTARTITAHTIKAAPNIVDGTPGTASAFRFYDDGNGWIAGIGISSGSVEIRSGWNLNLWSGQTGNQRNTVRINQNGLAVGVGAAVAAGVDPQAVLHVVNHGGAPSAIITTSTNTAVRIGPNGASSAIEGVDYTGLNAWRPLFVNGDVVVLGAQGYEAMRVTANRNVLIGTTVESAKLAIGLDGVADPNNYGRAIQITRGPSGGQQIAFIRNGAQVVSLGYMPGSSVFGFGLGNVTDASFWPNYLAIGTNGGIGIGVSSPAASLEVAGDILLTNNKAFKIRTSSGAAASLLNIDGVDTTRFYAPGPLHINPDSTGATYLNYNGTGPVVVGNGVLSTKFVVSKGYVGFGTGSPNANLSFGTSAGLNGLYLYDDGNAGATGFGISANTLNIFANALSTTNAAIAFGKYDKTTFTEWARLVDGRMGFGTANPVTRFDVVGTTVSQYERLARFSNAGNSRYLQVGIYPYSDNQSVHLQSYHTASDSNTWHLSLNPYGGNVCIGDGSPEAFRFTVRSTDTMLPALFAGATKGVRIVTNASTVALEGVDHTGVGSYQPLTVKGSTVRLQANDDKLFVNDHGVGIGGWAAASYALDVSGNPSLKTRFKNWGTTGRDIVAQLDVGGRYIQQIVNYDGQYFYENGVSVITRYSDFDNHIFRSTGGVDRVLINTNGLGIGMYPYNALDVMSSTVSTGFASFVNFQVPNSAGAATLTRFSIFQLGINSMSLEVANKDNAKGYLGLQPYGGLVTVGPYLHAGDPFSVQIDYDGHLNSTIYNHSIGDSAAAKFNMTVRDRSVSRMVYYRDRWMQERGLGVTQFYSEFDWHNWRNNAGADKMTLNANVHLWLANTTDPGTPGTGGYIYISGGALKYRGSGGTITTLAPA